MRLIVQRLIEFKKKNPKKLISIAIVLFLIVFSLSLFLIMRKKETKKITVVQAPVESGTSIFDQMFKTVVIAPKKRDLDGRLNTGLELARRQSNLIDDEIMILLGGNKDIPFVLTDERRKNAIELRNNSIQKLAEIQALYDKNSVDLPDDKKQIDAVFVMINEIIRLTIQIESLNRLLN